MKTLALFGVFLILLACEQAAPEPAPVQTAPFPVPEQPAVEEKALTHTVRIVRYSFVPETVMANKGDTVEWINEDGTSHSIKLLGAAPSPILAPGQTYEMALEDSGEYRYSCGIHAKMQGTIIVK